MHLGRFVVLLLFFFAIAGCGSSANSSTQSDTASADQVAASAPDDGEPLSDTDDEPGQDDEPKTLSEYLGGATNVLRNTGGQGGGGQGPRGALGVDEEALEQQRLVQVEIQRCMQAEGFTYVPEEVGDGLRFFLASANESLSAREYAETEGFGISTRFDAIFEGEFDLDESPDPNEEHLATLSEGEADAWQFALRGQRPERNEDGQLVDPETGEPIQGRATAGGCTGEAQVAVRGDFAQLAELADDFAEMQTRIDADPRVTELRREWTKCMGDAGFDFQIEDEARAEINQEFRPLLRSFFQSGQEQAGQGQAGRQGGGNRLAVVVGLELTLEQEQELGALQDRERALAITSLDCTGDSGQELENIAAAYEAEFVEANRAALEAFAS